MDFQTTCSIKPCRLTSETIEEIKGLQKYSYNPFTHYNGSGERELYLQFVAIDENDANDIFKFISTYGFLGFKDDKERNHQEELRQRQEELKQAEENHVNENEIHKKLEDAIKNFAIHALKETIKNPLAAGDAILTLMGIAGVEGNNLIKHLVDDTPENLQEQFFEYLRNLPPESEKIEDIKQEILIMRCLVLLWQGIKSKNTAEVIDQILNLSKIGFFPHKLDLGTSEDDAILVAASVALSHCINAKLVEVRPTISSTLSTTGCFQGLWQTSNLLSAMYVMLYMDLTRGVTLRKCQNQPCKEFFSIYGNDDRKIYCCESCSSSQKQRDYRRRKKEQKLK